MSIVWERRSKAFFDNLDSWNKGQESTNKLIEAKEKYLEELKKQNEIRKGLMNSKESPYIPHAGWANMPWPWGTRA